MSRKTVSLMAASLLTVGLALAIASCSAKATSSGGAGNPGTATVDVLYLNHPPVQPVLANADRVLSAYVGAVTVARYDFDTPQGQAFAKKKNVAAHVPIVIFINGTQVVELDGRKVTFQSFPKGEGSGMIPDGEWSMTDLDAALKMATGR